MFIKNKITYLAIGAVVIAFLTGNMFLNYEKNNTPDAQAAAGDVPLLGFAWSENIGWISFNSLNCDNLPAPAGDGQSDGGPGCPTLGDIVASYSVIINAADELSGYAWSENIGWIRFNPAGPYPVCPGATCPIDPSYPAKYTPATKKITGWARACAGLDDAGDGIPNNCEGPSRTDGWDGWILMGPVEKVAGDDKGVWIDDLIIPNEFKGWAWGSDVVGLISFNSKDCDPNDDGDPSDGPAECTEVGRDYVLKPIPNYKVYLGNSQPLVSDPTVNTDYCVNGINSILFSWSFDDEEDGSGNQSAYQIDLTRVEDSAPCTISENNNNLFITAATINLPANCPDFIDYNYNYTWSITVRDSGGSNSVPVSSAFSTPSHSYPIADFSVAPSSPWLQFMTITFDPFDPFEKSEVFGGSIISELYWDFGDGTNQAEDPGVPPYSAGAHTQTKNDYAVGGPYWVDLKVTDSDSNSCWASQQGNSERIDVDLNILE
jgi:hypothetical protein